jgi:putative ATPase
MSLALILRPQNLDDFIGQEHILNKNSALYKLILSKTIPHMFFYGRAGTGKTTLARLIAKYTDYDFYNINAISLKIEQLREIFKKYKNSLSKPLIFIDEVHRLTKTQQEVLLPVMEEYSAIIIGASTENPHFTLTSAVISRSFLYEFKGLSYNELEKVTQKAIKKLDISIDDNAKDYLIHSSSKDARALLNLLEFASKISNKITIDILKQLRENPIGEQASSSSTHYDLKSAMIKSLRGSDIDASLYYLARLINGGENIAYITRRLVIFASEDIGNANPHALNLATNTMISCNKIGYPESKIILGQCVVYLASSPKSNSSYLAINKALEYVNNTQLLEIPNYLKENPIGYKNPHDFGGFVEENYFDSNIQFYNNKNIGYEKILNDWIKKIKHNTGKKR